MKFLALVVSFLCLVVSSFSIDSATDKFERYQSLSHLGPIDLNDSSFEDLTSKPRDYHVAVVLTATDARFGCIVCREFQTEWELIARSWNRGSKPEGLRLLFGTLDFNNGRGTFQKLMLQTAPVVLVFPPTTGPFARIESSPLSFEFSGPVTADQIYAWINRHLPEGPKPPLVRPINYMRFISMATISVGTFTLFTVSSPYILPIIRNRNIWAAISLVAILLFTSGHMFNHIRRVPYVAGDGKGGINYFAGGFSNQFGMETQIIAAICKLATVIMYPFQLNWLINCFADSGIRSSFKDGILSFAAIALAIKVPRIADIKSQQLAVIIWGTVMLFMYSLLLSIFKVKNGGYPFFLPPF